MIMKCAECKTSDPMRYVHNSFWKTYLCERCVLGQVCAWCNQFGGCEPFEGIDVCRECRRLIIDTPEELDALKTEAIDLLSIHIGPNNLHMIPVMLKRDAAFGEKPTWLGVAMSREDLTLLQLESGIPHSYALAVLCHEFGHAILFRDHVTLEKRSTGGTHALKVEEGFCEVLCALALQSRSDPVARWQSFVMPFNPDPIYGDGFRLMWKAAQEVGSVSALLSAVSGDVIAFNGPRLDAVVDDSLEDVDLVAVVDAGRGDPTKGPLRGTALRVEDAPASVSRGPRLRGSALAVAKDHEREEKEVKKGGLRGAGLAIGLVREEEAKIRKSKAKEMDKTENKDSSRLRGTGIK